MARTELVSTQDGTLAQRRGRLEAARACAVDGIENAEAPKTKAAYASDERAFLKFCLDFELSPELPMSVETLGAWLADMRARGLKMSTINRRRAWVSKVHADQLDNPAKHPQIVLMIQGWSRTSPKAKGKQAITPQMIEVSWPSLSIRQRALVAVAFVTGMRASELIVLDWTDLESHEAGRVACIERSKTDQTGKGRYVAIPRHRKGGERCPVKALEALRAESGGEGLIFPVTWKTVARLAKRVASLASEDPSGFAAHSFRAGMITTASKAGIGLADIMEQSGHSSMPQANEYIRPISIMANVAADAVAHAM